jgi:hypothetical protein
MFFLDKQLEISNEKYFDDHYDKHEHEDGDDDDDDDDDDLLHVRDTTGSK